MVTINLSLIVYNRLAFSWWVYFLPYMDIFQTGSPDKISKLELAKDAGDGPENGEQNNTVEMDVEDHDDQNQGMSSEDESENSEAVMKSKTFNMLFIY